MKRSLITALAAILIFLTQCGAAAEDILTLSPEQAEALREAGMETENLLAANGYGIGGTPETAVFLMRAGNTAQLTVLEAADDGTWRVTAVNDTIPSSVTEYEHAPYPAGFTFVSPEPVKVPDWAESAGIDDGSGIPVPESLRDEAHRCVAAGPISEGYTWIIVADKGSADPWEEGEWYIIDIHGNA